MSDETVHNLDGQIVGVASSADDPKNVHVMLGSIGTLVIDNQSAAELAVAIYAKARRMDLEDAKRIFQAMATDGIHIARMTQ